MTIGTARVALVLAIAAGSSAMSSALAGEIYGELRAGGRPVPGEQVRLQCAGNVAQETQTDRFGSYRLYVAASGRCELSFRQATFQVAVPAEGAARYNFEFLDTGTSRMLLRR